MHDANGVPLTRDAEVTITAKVLGFSGEGSKHVIVQTEDQTRITIASNQVRAVRKEESGVAKEKAAGEDEKAQAVA